MLESAIGYWRGVDAGNASRLADVQVIISDLPGSILGLGSFDSPTIWLDSNAAGHGWHVQISDPSESRIDLLSVMTHELGHVLGLPDLDFHDHADHIMAAALPIGTRRVATDANHLTPALALLPLSYRTDSQQLFSQFDSREFLYESLNKTPLLDGLTGTDDDSLANQDLLAGAHSSCRPSADDRLFRRALRYRDPQQEEALDELFAEWAEDVSADMKDASELL